MPADVGGVDARQPDSPPEAEAPVRVEWYDGERDALQPLFTEAEDSAQQLDEYINDGRVLVAWRGTDPVGHLQLVTRSAASRCGTACVSGNRSTTRAGL